MCRAPGANGGKRIGDRVAGVVMRMNADVRARHMRGNFLDNPFDLMRQRSAIGVAQHDPSGSGRVRRLGAGQRVVAVGLEAVEEMLAVEDRLAAFRKRRLDRLADVFEVLLKRAAEHHMNMIIPGLAHEGDDIGLCC